MVMELPRFFALESVDVSKYLRHEKGDDANCTGEEVVSPYTKFEGKMPSKKDNNGKDLVHIRCCYNNKYLVKLDNSDRISPRATAPVEDQTDPSCTLFEPIFNNDGRVQFKHVQLNQAVGVYAADQNCIKVAPNAEASYFNVVNWQSLMVLPKHVAFKGQDGKYLNVLIDDSHSCSLVFSSDDAGDETVAQEVVTTRDGSICLKSDYTTDYWYQNRDDKIIANGRRNNFQPVKLADNIIALRCLSSNRYCRSVKDGDNYYLKADRSTISSDTRLEVEELVLRRSIYNVQFRKSDSRIYGETEITVASGEVVNRTNADDTVELKLSYADTRAHSWNFSGSLTFGAKYTIKTGVPLICESKIEISASITLGIQYTTTNSTTILAETVYKVNVPANTSVKVSLKATKGYCDVPFSYTQCDTLYNGQTETYRKHDGVFTGNNAYYLRYETAEKAL
ncbi:hypothetical protein C5167_029538 [Papaver somniferum]|uniref:uncharacterized protein LOC113334320 n=1 Tax=Papaver somniferum TaxID=3469 RepID=UPI000E6FD5BF|nr:uncharacterized protein LOC113334320 [Papaver somniferum]RZC88690.1 hypothetical protein C5167_029538 [Papaver somniferum]